MFNLKTHYICVCTEVKWFRISESCFVDFGFFSFTQIDAKQARLLSFPDFCIFYPSTAAFLFGARVPDKRT